MAESSSGGSPKSLNSPLGLGRARPQVEQVGVGQCGVAEPDRQRAHGDIPVFLVSASRARPTASSSLSRAPSSHDWEKAASSSCA